MGALYNMKKGTEYLNYGRNIIEKYCKRCMAETENKEHFIILDLGAGSGIDLINCAKGVEDSIKDIELWALESYVPNIEILRKKGIHVKKFNIEKDKFPFEDESVDFIIMNQILEHTKEIFWIFGEVSRVLRKGGNCIVGVPNLASLHNRCALMAGIQPTSIRALGPHVRGFTKNDFISFIETDGFFQVDYFAGSNFYPFPPQISNLLSKLMPNFAVSIFWGIKRTAKKGNFIHILDNRFFETPFYRGKENEIGET